MKNKNFKYTAIYTYIDYIYVYIDEVFFMAKRIKKNQFLHSPTLSTVLMVEDTLKSGELISIAELKRKLPKKVMHQTLHIILDYLQQSGKIIIGTKGILWVYTQRKELDTLIKKGVEL